MLPTYFIVFCEDLKNIYVYIHGLAAHKDMWESHHIGDKIS